jgi:hypothetical protein
MVEILAQWLGDDGADEEEGGGHEEGSEGSNMTAVVCTLNLRIPLRDAKHIVCACRTAVTGVAMTV